MVCFRSKVAWFGLLLPGLLTFRIPSAYSGSSEVPALLEASPVPDHRIAILDFKYEPETLTVARGSTVTWVNKDDEPHTATSSEKPKRFDSGLLETDQAYSLTFSDAGSYSYFCKLHPHMRGVIVVK